MPAKVVSAEIVEISRGLWCPACALPSGVAMTFAYHHPDGSLHTSTLAKCARCGGPVEKAGGS